MFRASTAHHQEVRCVYVANGTSKMTVSLPARSTQHKKNYENVVNSFGCMSDYYLFNK
jgi:hypothetical protein